MEYIIIGILTIFIIFIFLLWMKSNKELQTLKKDPEKIRKQKELELELFITEEKNKYLKQVRLEEQKAYEELRKRQEEMSNSFAAQRQKLEAQFTQDIENYKEMQFGRMKEIDEQIEAEKQRKLEDVQLMENHKLAIQEELETWKSKQAAVVESLKQQEEEREQEDFYRLTFSEDDQTELEELDKAIKKLKNPLPFRKAVYEVYYRHKVNDLVSRIVGRGRISGIYKITHIESGRTYVGQSVDIGERWKQHCKRGVGADTLPATNKLYPAMLELGITSFTFHIIETTTDTSRLGEMEKYWQDYYKSKEFGYSLR